MHDTSINKGDTFVFFAAMYRGTTSKAGRTRARKETTKKQDFENNDDESWKQYLVDDIKSEEESSSGNHTNLDDKDRKSVV